MSFLNLPEDVVCYALCICDISSVISISQTNKYLYHLAFVPTIWMSLVEDLRNRGFFDRLSATDIRKMSTQTLVALVRRSVVGPETWSPPRLQSPQPNAFSRIRNKLGSYRGQTAALGGNVPPRQASTPIVLRPAISPELPLPFHIELLRGGKYALFSDRGGQVLACWRVADNSLVGTYCIGIPSSTISDFAAEMLHGGERANIVICIRMPQNTPRCFVQVIGWDFATGVAELLSMTESTDYHSCTSPKICSNVVAVHAYRQSPWGKMYVIIDWHAQQCCKILRTGYLRFTLSRFNISMELVPDYFILTTISPSDITHEIRVYAMASLSGSWTPVGHHNTTDPVRLSDIPHVISSTVRLKGVPIRPGVLAVHESPLQCGVYRVWLHVQHSEPWLLGSRDHALLCKFRLSLPVAGGREFTWRQQSRIPAEAVGTTRTRGISYSGHTPAHWPPGLSQRILPPEIPPAPIFVEMPQETVSAWAKVAPYSGALIYLTRSAFVLYYFE